MIGLIATGAIVLVIAMFLAVVFDVRIRYTSTVTYSLPPPTGPFIILAIATASVSTVDVIELIKTAPHDAIDEPDSLGFTALSSAILSSRPADEVLALVETLIAGGADVNYVHPDGGDTALHFAVNSDLPNVVCALLAAGANPDVKAESGRAPRDLPGWAEMIDGCR